MNFNTTKRTFSNVTENLVNRNIIIASKIFFINYNTINRTLRLGGTTINRRTTSNRGTTSSSVNVGGISLWSSTSESPPSEWPPSRELPLSRELSSLSDSLSSSVESTSAERPKTWRATLEALEAIEAIPDLRLVYLLRNQEFLLAEVSGCLTHQQWRIREIRKNQLSTDDLALLTHKFQQKDNKYLNR